MGEKSQGFIQATTPNQSQPIPPKKIVDQALQPTKHFQFRVPVASQRTLTFTSCCSTAAARSRTTRLPRWRHRSIAELGKSLLGKKAPSNRAGKSTVFPNWGKKMGIDSSNIGFSQVYKPPNNKKLNLLLPELQFFTRKKWFHYCHMFVSLFLVCPDQQKKNKSPFKRKTSKFLRFVRPSIFFTLPLAEDAAEPGRSSPAWCRGN